MSDTPICDEHAHPAVFFGPWPMVVAVEHVAKLERKLAEVRGLLKKVWHCHTHPLSPQEQWDNLQRFLNEGAAPGGEESKP